MKLKNLAVNSALVVFSVAIAVAAVEFAVRATLEPPMYSRFTPEEDKDGIVSEGIPDGGFYENTPLGKRLKVNANGVVKKHNLTGTDIHLRTNSLGFRGGEIEKDGRARALFLGDSITLGDYLPEQATFTWLVGSMSTSTPLPLQTINAGVGSIGIEEEYNILAETGYRVEPDIVVLNLYLNDIQASPAMQLIPIPKPLRWSRIAQHVYQWRSVKAYEANAENNPSWIPREVEDSWKRQAAQKYPPGEGDWKTNRAAYNKMMVDWFGDWGAAYSMGGMNRMTRIAQQIIDRSKELGAKPMIVIHPTRFQVEATFNPREPQDEFIAYFNAHNVPVLDLLPPLRERFEQTNRALFYDHCHHKPEGAALVATQIFPFIMQNMGMNLASNH